MHTGRKARGGRDRRERCGTDQRFEENRGSGALFLELVVWVVQCHRGSSESGILQLDDSSSECLDGLGEQCDLGLGLAVVPVTDVRSGILLAGATDGVGAVAFLEAQA
jgi:hypothetical protein